MDKRALTWGLFSAMMMIACVIADGISEPLVILTALPAFLFMPGWGFLSMIRARMRLGMNEMVVLSIGISIMLAGVTSYIFNGLGMRTVLYSSIALYLVSLLTIATRHYPEINRSKILATCNRIIRTSKLVLLSVIIILVAVGVGAYMILTPLQGNPYTEMYLHDLDGTAAKGQNVTLGENVSVIIGLVNHEQRIVEYKIQVWLIDVTYVGLNNYSLLNLYYLDQINVTLDHVTVGIDETWSMQWEYQYNHTATKTGDFRLWFFLYKDDIPDHLANLEKWKDYSNEELTALLDFSLDSETQSVMVSIDVN